MFHYKGKLYDLLLVYDGSEGIERILTTRYYFRFRIAHVLSATDDIFVNTLLTVVSNIVSVLISDIDENERVFVKVLRGNDKVVISSSFRRHRYNPSKVFQKLKCNQAMDAVISDGVIAIDVIIADTAEAA